MARCKISGILLWTIWGLADVHIGDRLGIGLDHPAFALDILKPQAVTRLTTSSSVNGAVVDLRSTVSSPTYVAINFSNETNTIRQIGYLGTNQLIFRSLGHRA